MRDFVTNAISLSQNKSNNAKEETSSSRPAALAAVTQRIADEKPGRNEPCSCGSGKKYKACCGL
jgi:uncharacterized protein YecA (UPF0149 family)